MTRDNDWADLHGEDGEAIHIKRSMQVWCDRCQCYVDTNDLKIWTGDDAMHYLCPGCDADLLPSEPMEE